MKGMLLSVCCWCGTAAITAAQMPLETALYPLKVGNQWIYRATDMKAAGSKKVLIEVDRAEVYEQTVGKDKKGNDILKKFAGFMLKSTSDAKITFDHVVVTDKGICRVSVGGTLNSPGLPISPPLLFFKLPLKMGESWPANSTSGNVPIQGTFSWKSDALRVPAGEYNTVVISYSDGPANNPRVQIDTWFAQGVGMVKQRVLAKKHESILELEEFKEAK